MAVVHGTASNVAPGAVCEDPTCRQVGELLVNHNLVHRPTVKKGTKGACPWCHGPIHNTNDRADTIWFQCIARQVHGDKMPVASASFFTLMGDYIATGKVREWATRDKLFIHLGTGPKRLAATKPASTSVPPSTGVAAAGPSASPTTPPKTASAAPTSSTPASPSVAPPATAPTPIQPVSVTPITGAGVVTDADTRARVQAALKAAAKSRVLTGV